MSSSKPQRGRSIRADLLQPQIVRLLRPLVALLIRCGVTFPALSDILRALYVEVADQDFNLPDKAQTDSRISLLTGVHRKEVARLRGEQLPVAQATQSVSRSSQIIAVWTSQAPFIDENGQPLPLPRAESEEEGPNFDALVARVTKDVRPRAVLDTLLDQGIVAQDEQGRICLQQGAYIPKAGDRDQLYYFGRNLHDHMAAACANVQGLSPPLFERAVHYSHLSEQTAQTLTAQASEAAMKILLDVNGAANSLVSAEPEGAWRWSLGVYVYKEPNIPQQDEHK